MRIAKEELFGPILPVIPYDTVDQAIAYITARPRPLAMYPFGFSGAELDKLLTQTHSGGVSVDDWGWHVFNHDLPFGGIGNSGMGTYHGEEGFRELSHAKGLQALPLVPDGAVLSALRQPGAAAGVQVLPGPRRSFARQEELRSLRAAKSFQEGPYKRLCLPVC